MNFLCLTTFSYSVCAGSLLNVVPLDFHGVDDMSFCWETMHNYLLLVASIFDTCATDFTVLLWEITRATDLTLSMLLTKILEGICDNQVSEILHTRRQKQDISTAYLDKTLIICTTTSECGKINDQCLERISEMMCEYEADDSDNHGNCLRAADHQ